MFSPATFLNDISDRGAFEGYTHQGVCGHPGDGPFAQIWLLVSDGQVERCHYATHGCIWSMACAGACCRLASGRSVERALLIEPRDIDLILGGIPDGKGQTAEMAVEALRSALGEG